MLHASHEPKSGTYAGQRPIVIRDPETGTEYRLTISEAGALFMHLSAALRAAETQREEDTP